MFVSSSRTYRCRSTAGSGKNRAHCAMQAKEVVVICPRMRDFTEPEEIIDGIQVYRHWISEEAGAISGFFLRVLLGSLGEFRLLWKAWRRHRSISCIFATRPTSVSGCRAVQAHRHADHLRCARCLPREMFEAKFGKRGLLYWAVRTAEWCTHFFADVVIATNESVRDIAIGRGGQSSDNVFVVRTARRSPTRALAGFLLKKGRRYLVGYVGVMGNADGVRYISRPRNLVTGRGGTTYVSADGLRPGARRTGRPPRQTWPGQVCRTARPRFE
ncbi:MAG: hypothetical protein Ct9H300mP32_2140 [Verrucomicrobiota bacterium]|nr:MAG: hypothetical protein Ct9H300mP32_2140 [Verrucomicrobiota bacterium]